MKKILGYLAVAIAVFAGGFGALQLDGWFKNRSKTIPVFTLEDTKVLPASFQTSDAPFDFRSAVRKVLPSVVSVDRMDRVRRGFWDDESFVAQTGTGSGVIISSKGYILTNNHVVANAEAVNVRLADGRSFDADVVGTDPRSDLAVLKVAATNLTPAELGDSSQVEVGEWVIAVGTPLGYANTVSAGIVSSVNRTIPASRESALIDSIQTDAAINQGNSGGALANAAGQVIGINTMIVSQTGGSVGLGFAIPIKRAQRVVNDIVQYGRVRYGQLGAWVYNRPGLLDLDDVRAELKEATGAEPPKVGLIIQRIAQGSAASESGLQQLDVLVEIDGKRLREPIDLTKALIDKRPGDKVQLKYWARGSVKTANIVLSDL
ncbi:MAG TPA: trypsin-like peptidase domain-containing protein [Fimbriimonadaceae bacterium]|nr:trypsin-like peptidase domain-containing protein [Fimbriimonadaceae bacterium]